MEIGNLQSSCLVLVDENEKVADATLSRRNISFFFLFTNLVLTATRIAMEIANEQETMDDEFVTINHDDPMLQYFSEIEISYENRESEEATDAKEIKRPLNSSGPVERKRKESAWDHQNVLLFLGECEKWKEDLLNANVRRKFIFSNIQKTLKQHGVYFSVKSMLCKLRNFKISYIKRCERNLKRDNNIRIPWPYFDHLDKIYGEEVSLNLHLQSGLPITQEKISNASAVDTVSSPRKIESNIEHTSSTAALHKPNLVNRFGTIEEKLLFVEQQKLEVAKEILKEMRRLRLLKQQHFDIIKKKYKH